MPALVGSARTIRTIATVEVQAVFQRPSFSGIKAMPLPLWPLLKITVATLLETLLEDSNSELQEPVYLIKGSPISRTVMCELPVPATSSTSVIQLRAANAKISNCSSDPQTLATLTLSRRIDRARKYGLSILRPLPGFLTGRNKVANRPLRLPVPQIPTSSSPLFRVPTPLHRDVSLITSLSHPQLRNPLPIIRKSSQVFSIIM